MGSLHRNQVDAGVRDSGYDDFGYRGFNEGSDGFRMCIRELEQACIRSPRTSLRKALATRYMQAGRLEECIAVVTDLLRGTPGDSSLQVMLAEAYVEAGELEAASRARAGLMKMDVSLAELLRVSLKLREARLEQTAGQSSANTPDGPGKLPCPAIQDSMELEFFDEHDSSNAFEASPKCCEVVLAAIEEALESEEHEAEPDFPEYYVGPTRELRLSSDESDASSAGADVTQTSDLRRNLAEYFST